MIEVENCRGVGAAAKFLTSQIRRGTSQFVAPLMAKMSVGRTVGHIPIEPIFPKQVRNKIVCFCFLFFDLICSCSQNDGIGRNGSHDGWRHQSSSEFGDRRVSRSTSISQMGAETPMYSQYEGLGKQHMSPFDNIESGARTISSNSESFQQQTWTIPRFCIVEAISTPDLDHGDRSIFLLG